MQPNSQTNDDRCLKKYYEETINKLECIQNEMKAIKNHVTRGNNDAITALKHCTRD